MPGIYISLSCMVVSSGAFLGRKTVDNGFPADIRTNCRLLLVPHVYFLFFIFIFWNCGFLEGLFS